MATAGAGFRVTDPCFCEDVFHNADDVFPEAKPAFFVWPKNGDLPAGVDVRDEGKAGFALRLRDDFTSVHHASGLALLVDRASSGFVKFPGVPEGAFGSVDQDAPEFAVAVLEGFHSGCEDFVPQVELGVGGAKSLLRHFLFCEVVEELLSPLCVGANDS